jgi:hypothetical protein
MELIPKQKKRLVLTSVNQVITLARNNSALIAKMPKLTPLTAISKSTGPKKPCNCGGKINIVTTDPSKQMAENILSALTSEDFMQIKNILGLDELCYYKRNTAQDKLELICV